MHHCIALSTPLSGMVCFAIDMLQTKDVAYCLENLTDELCAIVCQFVCRYPERNYPVVVKMDTMCVALVSTSELLVCAWNIDQS